MTSPASSARSFTVTSRGGFPATVPDIMKAQNLGAKAVNRNEPVGACPYGDDRSERGRFLALMWFRAYRARQQQLHDSRG